MCQGDPIEASVLVAIMGPPEIKENNYKYCDVLNKSLVLPSWPCVIIAMCCHVHVSSGLCGYFNALFITHKLDYLK